MVTMFLVEDEKLARESIRDNIDWNENGIELLGEASDGELALPRILDKKPDILLTDIKMPFMDGLQLSKLVKKKLPNIKIIILSGHDEFDYARQAISLGVNDYLLKPVSSRNILRSVLKVKDQIEQERHKEQSYDLHESSIHKLFLNALLSGFLTTTQDILEFGEQLQINFGANVYLMCIFRYDGEDHEDAFTAIKEYTKDAENQIRCFQRNEQELVLLLQGEDEDYLNNWCTSLIGLLEENGIDAKKAFVQGSIAYRIADIATSYQSANARLSSPKEKQSSFHLEMAHDINREEIYKLLRYGEVEEIHAFWDACVKNEAEAMKSYLYQGYLYTEMFFIFSKICNEMELSLSDVYEEEFDIEKIIIQHKDVKEFLSIAYAISDAIVKKRKKPGTRCGSTVERAKKYIQEHYMEDDLSLNTVAGFVNITPSYFSGMFKEKTGQNFSEYLSEVRINEAKRLLKTTDLHASEIAYQVGFHNANYFSVIFKKLTGKVPSDFR